MSVTNIFINLPVKNLNKSMAFFKRLGFSFNPRFTDKNAACLVIGKTNFAMLITEKMFQTFTKKKISNAKQSTEVLIAMQVKSKKEVDALIKKARSAGARSYLPRSDHGWMYSDNFIDPDGHQWEVFAMDPKKMPKN